MNAAVYTLSAEHISSYLQFSGWQLVNQNDRCYVFEGYEDVDDNPFEIVLPINENAPDYPIYVEHTVRILSSLTDKSLDTIAKDMVLFNHDLLTIEVDSNRVEFAATQVPRIKGLIGHAANSERDAKPCFSRYSTAAKRMLKHFRLSCTQNGNSGYRVESEVGELVPYQMSLPLQKPRVKLPAKLPIQRRVMERIATGLLTAETAAQLGDAQPLVEGYADGFNANMCDAVLKLANMQQEPIYIRVKWSKKIGASRGLKAANRFQIERRHIDYLKRASDKLKVLKPEFQIIRGLVVGLSSLGDPQSDDVDARSIIVHWEHGRGRPRKLLINLGKHDYLKAHQAHVDWKTISVDGIAIKRRSGWQLSDPQEFKILR